MPIETVTEGDGGWLSYEYRNTPSPPPLYLRHPLPRQVDTQSNDNTDNTLNNNDTPTHDPRANTAIPLTRGGDPGQVDGVPISDVDLPFTYTANPPTYEEAIACRYAWNLSNASAHYVRVVSIVLHSSFLVLISYFQTEPRFYIPEYAYRAIPLCGTRSRTCNPDCFFAPFGNGVTDEQRAQIVYVMRCRITLDRMKKYFRQQFITIIQSAVYFPGYIAPTIPYREHENLKSLGHELWKALRAEARLDEEEKRARGGAEGVLLHMCGREHQRGLPPSLRIPMSML